MTEHPRPGSVCPDAPVENGWLRSQLGKGFTITGIDTEIPKSFAAHGINVSALKISAKHNEAIMARYLGQTKSAVYLIRPDQHVAARWDHYDEVAIKTALAQAMALG